MEREIDYFKKYSKTGSVIASIGVIVLLGTIIFMLFLNQDKSEEIKSKELVINKKDSIISYTIKKDSLSLINKKDSIIKKVTDSIVKTSKLFINGSVELKKKYDSLNKVISKLRISLKTNKNEIVECVGRTTGKYNHNGYPLYNFIMRINNPELINKLRKVEYYFDHQDYTPRLKSSINAKSKFRVDITNSYGCLNIVNVYLHYSNNQVDTFPYFMCDKLKIELPNYDGKPDKK